MNSKTGPQNTLGVLVFGREEYLVDSVEVVVRSSEPSENGAVLCFFGTTTVPSDSRRMGISLSEPPPSEGARDSGLKRCW